MSVEVGVCYAPISLPKQPRWFKMLLRRIFRGRQGLRCLRYSWLYGDLQALDFALLYRVAGQEEQQGEDDDDGGRNYD